LKTLEEPPEHVKFIFCTTDPNKIPVTILSRCQRFDFAGIVAASIAQRLRQIVELEGVTAEPEAIEVLARRAAGSMRDGQSLLEQLLAFAPENISVDDVNNMLGTAGDQRMMDLLAHLVDRDSAGALADLDAAMGQGVDHALLLEQLFGYLRDCMTAAVGCSPEVLLYASPANQEQIAAVGNSLGLQTILAAMQILEKTLSRLRQSMQSRILAELALVRICALEDLDDLANLIAEVQSGAAMSAPAPRPATRTATQSQTSPQSIVPQVKKKDVVSSTSEKVATDDLPSSEEMKLSGYNAGQASSGTQPSAEGSPPLAPASPTETLPPAVDVPTPAAEDSVSEAEKQTPADDIPSPPTGQVLELTPQNSAGIWQRVLDGCSGLAVENAKQADRVANSAPNRLVISFKPGYTLAKSICEKPEHTTRFQGVLSEILGTPATIEFKLLEGDVKSEVAEQAARVISPQQRNMEAAAHPYVRRAEDLFGAQPVRVSEHKKPE
ncbi:MAG: hypothetical protein JXM70_08500, partial [Pirellulales bacterium]|nr:hypothetical protein [Pirellulales bacterium]